METHEKTEQQIIPCRHLRCKEMYHQSPDDDEFASGQFWCNRTQEGFGPDGSPCGKKECCANRSCYVT